MSAKKGRKGKARKGTPDRKPRLWLRDLGNLIGGLALGVVGTWVVEGHLEGKKEAEVSRGYVEGVRQDVTVLGTFSERYLALSEGGGEQDGLLVGLDITRPVCDPDRYRGLGEDLHHLGPRAAPPLLAYVRSLSEAELLRKLLMEQQKDPNRLEGILARELLRSLHEGLDVSPHLLWALEAKPREEPAE